MIDVLARAGLIVMLVAAGALANYLWCRNVPKRARKGPR